MSFKELLRATFDHYNTPDNQLLMKAKLHKLGSTIAKTSSYRGVVAMLGLSATWYMFKRDLKEMRKDIKEMKTSLDKMTTDVATMRGDITLLKEETSLC